MGAAMPRLNKPPKKHTPDWRARLASEIEARGLTLREVSLKAECTPDYLSKLFKGRVNPSVDRLVRLCDAIGVPPADIFSAKKGFSGILSKMGNLTPAEAEILKILLAKMELTVDS